MKNKKISLVLSVGVLIFAFAFFASQVFGQSWTPPTQQFPQGNTSAPLDVSTEPQTKGADLGVRTIISNVQGTDFALQMPAGSFIGTTPSQGGNKFWLSAGNNMVFSAAGGFLVNAPGGPASFTYSKGLTLPNYSTAALGTGVQEGTLTYNNGKLYIFVPGGGQGQQQETRNNLLNNANAQTFNGRWTEVGGGTVINNFSSSSVPGVWLPGRGGVYTTTTVVSVGPNSGVNLKMEVSANAINFRSVVSGANQGNNSIVNKAVAQSEPIIFSAIPGTGAVSFPAALTAQSTLNTQGIFSAQNTINAQGVNGISVTPSGAQAYSIKNNSGTIGFYNAGNIVNFGVGQDGVVTVKDKIAYQGTSAQVVGTSGSESVLQVGGTYGNTFRPGVLRFTHPNGTDTVSLKQEFGKTLSISEPGNNKTLKINLDNVLATSCFNVNGLAARKFLKVDANGWILCEDVIPQQAFQEFSWVATNHQEITNTIAPVANYFCALTGFESDDTIQFGKCNVRVNGSNWEMNMRSGGQRGLRCTARCFQFK